VDERAFDERYRHWAPRSGELFTEASCYIPGGAGSSARTVKFGWKPYPPFMADGFGSHLRDVDGHSYVDYLLGLGPMILGHRHPAVTRAVSELGTCFGLPYELDSRPPARSPRRCRGWIWSGSPTPAARLSARPSGWANTFLLVVGLTWLDRSQPDGNLLVKVSHASHAAPEQPVWLVVRNQTEAI